LSAGGVRSSISRPATARRLRKALSRKASGRGTSGRRGKGCGRFDRPAWDRGSEQTSASPKRPSLFRRQAYYDGLDTTRTPPACVWCCRSGPIEVSHCGRDPHYRGQPLGLHYAAHTAVAGGGRPAVEWVLDMWPRRYLDCPRHSGPSSGSRRLSSPALARAIAVPLLRSARSLEDMCRQRLFKAPGSASEGLSECAAGVNLEVFTRSCRGWRFRVFPVCPSLSVGQNRPSRPPK